MLGSGLPLARAGAVAELVLVDMAVALEAAKLSLWTCSVKRKER